MNNFLYLSANDCVIFLFHMRKIEVKRLNGLVTHLIIHQADNELLQVKDPNDIEWLCNYFYIPLYSNGEEE
jgi:hypothetical protein